MGSNAQIPGGYDCIEALTRPWSFDCYDRNPNGDCSQDNISNGQTTDSGFSDTDTIIRNTCFVILFCALPLLFALIGGLFKFSREQLLLQRRLSSFVSSPNNSGQILSGGKQTRKQKGQECCGCNQDGDSTETNSHINNSQTNRMNSEDK